MNKIRDQKLIDLFGKHLRKLRAERGLSMRELALIAEIEYKQIFSIENGKVNCTISTLNAIAKALDIPLKELMDF